ncbi:hypothetical protein MOMUL_17790 [Moorella mulderi DSM 14980]|uniref:Transposase InsH N-terminal domain-containing protein n=1 Tax=Moorella mulderi DSM 14980 TaxID=1122241 RepID=A0A151AX22_9FIRM|nr:hypothetical protein MOMUL_17790 [Moorella mulderi DSM 14980]
MMIGFEVCIGRPTILMETNLHMTYLKYRYGLGYEVLVQEVNDSTKWRYCYLIPLTQKVPHATTLILIKRKYGLRHSLSRGYKGHHRLGRVWNFSTMV